MILSSFRRAGALLLPCLVAAGLHAQPQPAAGRSVTKLYTDLCLACHGQKWEGGRAPSMLDDVWMHPSDDAGLTKSIRDGWIENAMPPFGAVLNAQEIRAMVVFIRESREKAKQEKKEPPPEMNGLQFDSEKHRFKIEVVAAGLETPWGMAFLPDGRLLVTERPGRLRIVAPGKGIVETISGVPKVWLRQDGGLFDLALHPNFAREPWVYLAYSDTGGSAPNASGTTIIRAKLSGNALVEPQTLFKPTPEQYWVSNTHYGARFLFDRAGFLYFSIGDRGHRDDSQDLRSPYGKLHRIRDDGRVPTDNPFVDRPGAIKTIWSYGHRNQQGIAQHPLTGEIWTTEHGPRGGDELNVIARGKNYGWPVITYGMNDDGTPITDQTAKEGMEQPVAYWTPSIAVSGIEFYTGDKFPAWKGSLFMAALAGRQFRRLEIDGHKVTHQEVLLLPLGRRVRDVQAGPDGLIYVLLNMEFGESPGHVIRLVPVAK